MSVCVCVLLHLPFFVKCRGPSGRAEAQVQVATGAEAQVQVAPLALLLALALAQALVLVVGPRGVDTSAAGRLGPLGRTC